MFGRKKSRQVTPYDRMKKVPVIRSSICTGEQTAGFKDLASGKFQEVMLIRNEADLKEFLVQYQIEPEELRREW